MQKEFYIVRYDKQNEKIKSSKKVLQVLLIKRNLNFMKITGGKTRHR